MSQLATKTIVESYHQYNIKHKHTNHSDSLYISVEYIDTVVTFPLTTTERIAIVVGDVFGWYGGIL